MNFLNEIILNKKKEIEEKKTICPLEKLKTISSPRNPQNFKKAISTSGKINLIAEIKHASPSKGVIRENFNHKEVAKIYDLCKVSAISVLTEQKYFLGNLQYLKDVHEITAIPIIMKDFVIDEYQIYSAYSSGASAILLIAAILDLNQIKSFLDLAHGMGLDCLVEVHDKEELDKVLLSGADIIGINNRNLKTFRVDLKTSFDLKKEIPKDKIVVSESGIKTKQDILELKNAGFNAVLIGETFMRAQNIEKAIKEVWNE